MQYQPDSHQYGEPLEPIQSGQHDQLYITTETKDTSTATAQPPLLGVSHPEYHRRTQALIVDSFNDDIR